MAGGMPLAFTQEDFLVIEIILGSSSGLEESKKSYEKQFIGRRQEAQYKCQCTQTVHGQ